MKKDFFYRIVGFWPDDGLAAHGFQVDLANEYAKKALETKMSEKTREIFQSRGESLLEKLNLNKRMLRRPYQFHEDTALLQFCTVPGDACDIGVDGGEFSNFLERPKTFGDLQYVPHNVEHVLQAHALLALWLAWADYIHSA